jgi:serine/threonine protein kinase
MTPPPDRAKSVFLAALDVPAGDARRAYVAAACGGDAALAGEVDQLLRHHDAAGSFLDPAAGPTGAFDPGPDAETAAAAPPESGGTEVGPYKLLEPIGEGGFGVVFLAEQQRPVRRKVALKVLKPGMDTKQVVARFEAERQALALMDHPNIAKVFDGG